MAWTQLFGMVSLELFGHYVGATTDFDAVFDYEMRWWPGLVGLAPAVGVGYVASWPFPPPGCAGCAATPSSATWWRRRR